MGRRPNAVIAAYFERGPKLNDNSNRYPHRCRRCGEDFPKGRIDSLIRHLSERCPAIPHAERVQACLKLHGLGGGDHGNARNGMPKNQTVAGAADAALAQTNPWIPLETLAEVSRQADLNEKHSDNPVQPQNAQFDTTQPPIPNPLVAPSSMSAQSFDIHEQFTLDNPPLNFDDRQQRDKDMPDEVRELTMEEKLRNLLQADGSPADSNLSVAAAATARLNPALLDPQLHSEGEDGKASEPIPSTEASLNEMMPSFTLPEQVAAPVTFTSAPAPMTGQNVATAWGELTYIPEGIQAPAIVSNQSQQLAFTLQKGGNRMDTGSPGKGHARARFDAKRREDVREVRRIGACIRCRILRKTCSKGTPCDTCRKVLSPRVWMTGCVRTKLAEQLELYSAGVQIVVAQTRVNRLKSDYSLSNNGVFIEASHFHETGHKMLLEVVQGRPKMNTTEAADESAADLGDVIMIDSDKEDIPLKVEAYMREVLPELISREPSDHVRLTLQHAVQVVEETKDDLLRRALELWGFVEMMDRERQWTFLQKLSTEDEHGIWVKDQSEHDTFTNICMQLTAAAERKAAATSKALLNGVQRYLQDGKTKLGFPMFLTGIVFLNCVEKTTWAFRVWEGEILRPLWPLERQPSDYHKQGYRLCDLLKMLMLIRHVLPKVSAPDPDSPLVAEDDNEAVRNYYRDINVTPNFLRHCCEGDSFDQSDSRSLEFLFCSTLLLP